MFDSVVSGDGTGFYMGGFRMTSNMPKDGALFRALNYPSYIGARTHQEMR